MGAPAYNNTLSSGMLVKSFPKSVPLGIRLFNKEEIEKCSIGAAIIGRGSSGTCYFAKLGPLQVCKKVHRSEPKMIGYFYNEVTMLKNLCHENLPFLFGACVQEHHPKCILMSMHSFTNSGDVLNVEDALRRKDSELPAAFSITDWKCILHGTLSALEYLHLNTILHNDIKANNVVIEKILHTPDSCRPVLIDFGKACYVKDARTYELSIQQRRKYDKKYPQLALEVVQGVTSQSYESDIYSFGRILSQINSQKLRLPILTRMGEECLSSEYKRRPTAKDLKVLVFHLF